MLSSTQTISTSLKIVYVILAFILCFSSFRVFFRPAKTVEVCIHRATSWSKYLHAHNQAISILKYGINNLSKNAKDTAKLNFFIGMEYYYKRDYSNATIYFDKTSELFKAAKFPFDPGYLSMIVSYYNIGEEKKAKTLYKSLKKQEKYDIRFKDLEALESRIFHS